MGDKKLNQDQKQTGRDPERSHTSGVYGLGISFRRVVGIPEKTGFQTVSQKYEHGTDPGIQVNDNPVFGRDKQVGIQRSQTPV